jgi:hypothetical protein
MLRHVVGAVIAALVVAYAGTADAQRVKAGVLTCDVSAGIGLIVGSQRQVACVFAPELPGPEEPYFGSITKFGLDIGATSGGVMVWAVFAAGGGGPGFLAGDYVGATADVTIAVGLGANVLVGGSDRTVALQPVSVSSQIGFNLAIGVADLQLRSAR